MKNRSMPMPHQKRKIDFVCLKRVLHYVTKKYKIGFSIVLICILLVALTNVSTTIFIEQLINNYIKPLISDAKNGIEYHFTRLALFILAMGGVYTIGIITSFLFNRLMGIITQKVLNDIRIDLFSNMQKLPIKYFDTHLNGDIMSVYTNDVDSLRQLLAQSIPQSINAAITIISSIIVMISYSIYLTIAVFLIVIIMLFVTRKIGGNSTKFFIKQQESIGKVDGYIEEVMNGQKVVKVFCHEEKSKEDFDKLNEQLFNDSRKANTYANILMPIMGNLGYIMYVFVAIIGSLLFLYNVPNLSIAGIAAINIGIVAAFLQMSRTFTMSINNISQQINSIAMALAGAKRIFELMDEQPEVDHGYVTLVNAQYNDKNELVEADHRTGIWAWKHPHEDGTITYTKLTGDIRMFDVDFGYTPDKIVLHNVTLYAEPGQKVAFVGATGAGKTTITNLLNRFYDIADGKIRYDGININKIKKPDLRRSLGMILQDTNLFTGTVKENIRYGRLDATDEEVIEAAKIANADDFINTLPEGYDTMLESDGANLSQGQRQLLSIARATLANAPVLIMDEATSSIDTRTETIVQKGTDQMMKGRTVFVIAHRLSTIQNSDVIMVLDHGHIIERGSHDQLIKEKGMY